MVYENRSVLDRGWKYFDIMHKERRVARIYESGVCTINFPSFMPYNLYLEKGNDVDTCVNNLGNFYYWCASRVLTLDRKYAKAILNSIGAAQVYTDRERAAIAISYRALSLMDVHWVRAKGDTATFTEISLYRHSLSTAFVDVSLRGKHLTLENAALLSEQDPAGDVATPGVSPKAWIREGDAFYLLKDGDERDVNAELLASKIVGCFAVKYVPYEESTFDGTRVSRCRIITSEEKSIASCDAIEVYCVNHDMKRIDFVLKKDAYGYYMMNVIDYLIGNVDRHWGNWGFYVDTRTNKIESLYPLMDFNKAFKNYGTLDGAMCQTTAEHCSQKQAAIEAVEKVGLNLIAEIKREWFPDAATADMFFARLAVLQNAAR